MRRLSSPLSKTFLGLCFLFVAPSTAAAATPSDITVLRSLTGPELKAKSTKDLELQLTNLALARTDTLAQSRGYPASLLSSNNPLVRQHITKTIKAGSNTRSLGAQAAAKRILDLGLSIMSGHMSENALAYAAHQPPPRGNKTNKQAQPLSHSAKVSSQGPLILDLNRSSIKNDKGTFGAHNGILDPGEIATLNLSFANNSTQRLVSTSLYIKSLSKCLFTTKELGKEIQLAEMVPKSTSLETGLPLLKGTSNVKIDIYASSECAGQTGTIVMHAYDTHRFASTPIRYVLTLSLSDAAEARLANVRIDRDDYGHSEPQTDRVVQPGEQIEVSAGLALGRSGYSFSEQSFLPPLGTANHSHVQGLTYFRPLNGRYVAPMHDDLDLSFSPKITLLQQLEPLAVAYGWQSQEDARIYLAVDTRFGKQSQKKSAQNGETTYSFKSSALTGALSDHLHVEVDQRSATGSTKGRLAIGQVEGFRIEIDDPGPLLANLQNIDLTINRPEPVKDSEYNVRHYIELPIFWERILTPTCKLTAPGSAKVGKSFQVRFEYTGIPVGAHIMVNGLGLNYDEVTAVNEDSIYSPSAKMVNRNVDLSLQIIDLDGSTICRANQRVYPIAPPKPAAPKKVFVKHSNPELPMGTLTVNRHSGWETTAGYDFTASLGRKLGVVFSSGRIGGGKAQTLGLKASQLLHQAADGFQFNLTESIEVGRGWIDMGGPYSHTRASLYLSAHRIIGLNAGMHLETNQFGAPVPSFRLGVGGFFGGKYE
jgi:hypothetical protein